MTKKGQKTKSQQERKQYTPINLNHDNEFYAKLAGFIEGDGSLYSQLKKMPGYKYGYQIAVTLQLTQKESNRSILDNYFKAFGGSGHFNVRKETKYFVKNKSDEPREIDTVVVDYKITKKEDLIPLLKKLLPFFKLKKQQAELLLAIAEKQKPGHWQSVDEFLGVCKLVDELSALHGNNPARKNTTETVIKWLKDNEILDKNYDSP